MSDSDISDYEEAVDILSGKPTASDVKLLQSQLSEKKAAVVAYLLSSREPVDKRRLIESTLNDILDAFNAIATTYLSVAAASRTACSVKTAFKKIIGEEVIAAMDKVLPSRLPAHTGASYADVVNASSAASTRKIKVNNGPTVIVPKTVSVVIGPKAGNDSLSSADDTRKAILKAVKPKDVDMKVNKVVNTRNKSVRIIAESVDVSKLKGSPALAAAGLEIKDKEMLNPRLVIRDVPTDRSNADLITDIISLNLDDPSPDSIKVVYRYPSRLKNDRASVVIEVTAEIRRKLLGQGRVYLPWHSCRVEDHLRLLQCFKCQCFSHLAIKCILASVCGKCTGAHETSTCILSAQSYKCVNCVANKYNDVEHRAFDAVKCPVIRRRLTEKAKHIRY